MLDLLFIILMIFCIFGWLYTIIKLILNWVGYDAERIDWIKGAVAFVLSFVISIITWYVGIKVEIKDNIAEIKAYQQYKSNFDFDKKIDTEIEQKYISALQRLEYLKSIGLYKEEPIILGKYENNFPEPRKIDYNTSMNEIIEEYGNYGQSGSDVGFLFGERFWIKGPDGNYHER